VRKPNKQKRATNSAAIGNGAAAHCEPQGGAVPARGVGVGSSERRGGTSRVARGLSDRGTRWSARSRCSVLETPRPRRNALNNRNQRLAFVRRRCCCCNLLWPPLLQLLSVFACCLCVVAALSSSVFHRPSPMLHAPCAACGRWRWVGVGVGVGVGCLRLALNHFPLVRRVSLFDCKGNFHTAHRTSAWVQPLRSALRLA
jgi:hypothetical protein